MIYIAIQIIESYDLQENIFKKGQSITDTTNDWLRGGNEFYEIIYTLPFSESREK
jgi:hypothetical protein